MKTSPAFQFYPGDWLSSQRVQLMTLEEEGAYIRLLAYCWLHGSLPADPEKLARLIGKGASTTLATTVATMFKADGDKLVHERLEEEREKQELWRRKSSLGGKKSAEKRKNAGKNKDGSTTLQPPLEGSLENGGNQTATLQSSSSSSNITPIPPSREDEELKEGKAKGARDTVNEAAGRLYAAYPRKVARPAALRAIAGALGKADEQTLLAGVERWAAYWRASGTEERHIPHASTWFNQERWNDAPPAPPHSLATAPAHSPPKPPTGEPSGSRKWWIEPPWEWRPVFLRLFPGRDAVHCHAWRNLSDAEKRAVSEAGPEDERGCAA